MTRYIHDGEIRNATEDLPPVFVFDETNHFGRGRTDRAALFAKQLTEIRKTREKPLVIDHE